MSVFSQLKQKTQMLRLKFLIAFSYFVLLSEKIVFYCWRLAYWLLLFCALWLFEIPSIIGFHSDILAPIIFLGGCIYFIWTDIRLFSLPHKNEVLQRLEHTSQLHHQPLRLMRDRPIEEKIENPLWEREITRRQNSLKNLKLSPPHTNVPFYDRYGLRLLIILSAICGLWVAGSSSPERIIHGLFPNTDFETRDNTAGLTLLLTPPDYTGQPQIVVQGSSNQTLQIPEGSTIKIVLNKSWGLPFFTPSLKIGEKKLELTKSDKGTFMLEALITQGQTMSLSEGPLHFAAWQYDYIPDTPPAISLNGPAEPLESGKFQIPLELIDDYGVRAITVQLESAQTVSLPPFIQPAEETQLIMSPAKETFQTAPVFDFGWHGLAGRPVRINVSATDAKGQTAQSEPFEMILPERRFRNPLARALITIRKALLATPLQNYTDYAFQIDGLMNLGMERSVYMGMRSAASRLYHNEPSNVIAASVIALLWELAIRIEDGSFGMAEKNMQDVQNRLGQALQDPNTAPEQVSALIQELREAMARYLQEAAQVWQEQAAQGNPMPDISPEMLGEMMDMTDLAAMMDKLEAALMSGDKKAAQEMLAQLQRLMQMASPAGGKMPQDVQDMMKAGEQLKQIIDDQEKLLAETLNQAELFSILDEMGMMKSRDPATFNKTPEMTENQNKIQQSLQSVIKLSAGAFSKPPENLSKSLEQMAQSQSALSQGEPANAIPAQEEALRLLKESQQQMQSQMSARLQQMTGISFSGAPRRYDPLGRPYGGQDGQPPGSGSEVKVPDEAEIRRVQEIVDEIRRRASERDRPHEELEYFRRLLRRF